MAEVATGDARSVHDGRPARPHLVGRVIAHLRGWIRKGDTAVAHRELDHKDWRQMRRLAEACNDQEMAVGIIYEDAGVASSQRFSLRGPS